MRACRRSIRQLPSLTTARIGSRLSPSSRALANRSSGLTVSKVAPRCVGASQLSKRSFAGTRPTESALGGAARTLRNSLRSHDAVKQIAEEADAVVDQAAALTRLRHELRGTEEELMEVSLLGETLADEGRRRVSFRAPMGLGGGAPARKLAVVLPNVEDISGLFADRKEHNYRMEKPSELVDILDKFLREKFIARGADHVGLLAAWGPKTLGDSQGEFSEVAALMLQFLAASRVGLDSSASGFQFELNRVGDEKDCLVMPPSNFCLLGLKDLFHNLLQGYRVIACVQPRFFPHYKEIQNDLVECGLPKGLFEVVPGITPEADPEVLHEILRHVDRLQFTGSSAMFRSLCVKAVELGNLRMENAGEVSGLNKIRLDGVSASHPAAVAGAAWAAMANNGELCTSASLVEFDPATGDTAASVKAALESHSFKLGSNPEAADLNVLLKEGKTSGLEVHTEASELREWWEKAVLAVPSGGSPNTQTNQSLGHCIFAPSIARALELGVKEDASCIYCVGVPGSADVPSARAGTTGCKLPESAFGGMKSHTFAVAGDHDGVGTLQTVLNLLKRRAASWRDGEEVQAEYELTETSEMLLDFLSAKEQTIFQKQINAVLDLYGGFQPEVVYAYAGQPLVGAEGRSQLVTLQALRPSRKRLFIPRGGGLPEDIVKMAVLCDMSPLREVPVDLHIMTDGQTGTQKLRVTDPLKSFLRVAERSLNWRIHYHDSVEELCATIDDAEYPPYFHCVKDRHILPSEFLRAVYGKGGFVYERLPSDALSLFRQLTATQAWTIACTGGQVDEAAVALREAWQNEGCRAEPHPTPEFVAPTPQADVGGGFNAGGMDDKEWGELDSDSSSDSDDDSKPVPKKAAKAEVETKKDAVKEAEIDNSTTKSEAETKKL